MAIKEKYLVKKRNVLNELRVNCMTLQELRFFSIYLSRINPRDLSTRIVRFSIADFQAIMELGRINIEYMKNVTNGLLSKVINVPTERGGYTGFQLFKQCRVDHNEFNEWYIEIDAHDKALPLMFEYKDEYFSYQLWNALHLKSANQLKMYELLKQYEKLGTRIIPIEKLRSLLGIEKKEYKAYKDFRVRVLEACQQALRDYTDISFTYEPYGKKGPGGKILFLKFNIKKNKDYVDQLTLAEFIDGYQVDNDVRIEPDDGNDISDSYRDKIAFLSEACNHEFSFQETVVLYNEMQNRLPEDLIREDIQCYDYLNSKYQEMAMRGERTKISHRFAYLRSMIGKEKEYEK